LPAPVLRGEGNEGRSPLAQLLHALNQPLTGLQCSMEVALGAPRTAEQYRQGLRQGLELTGRMRELVEAIREVVEGQEAATAEEPEMIELPSIAREILEDLEPVAAAKNVEIKVTWCAPAPAVRATRQRLYGVLFQSLEAAMSLAARGTELQIVAAEWAGMTGARAEWSMGIMWQAEGAGSRHSRGELGLLVAQAGWERMGAEWRRERAEKQERVPIRMRCSEP
jgi:signal transduction histidine kinase